MKKPIIITLGILFLASCGTTHKVVNTSKKKVDSSATVTRDTSHVFHEEDAGDMFHVRDVHIRVEYPADTALKQAKQRPSDTTVWTPLYVRRKPTTKAGEIADAIRDAISASGGAGRLPSSITVDIGSVLDSTYYSSRRDSANIHATSQVDMHRADAEKNKEVTRTGLSLGYKIGIGLFLFIVLIVAAWRLWQKFKPL